MKVICKLLLMDIVVYFQTGHTFQPSTQMEEFETAVDESSIKVGWTQRVTKQKFINFSGYQECAGT